MSAVRVYCHSGCRLAQSRLGHFPVEFLLGKMQLKLALFFVTYSTVVALRHSDQQLEGLWLNVSADAVLYKRTEDPT
eukprot:3421181-Amphidinium_carterae.1